MCAAEAAERPRSRAILDDLAYLATFNRARLVGSCRLAFATASPDPQVRGEGSLTRPCSADLDLRDAGLDLPHAAAVRRLDIDAERVAAPLRVDVEGDLHRDRLAVLGHRAAPAEDP